MPGVEPPEPTRLGEVVWLQPYPDALLEGVPAAPPGPPRYPAGKRAPYASRGMRSALLMNEMR